MRKRRPITNSLPQAKGRIAVDEGELERLPDLRLTSRMPAEAFIQTGERTALSYLTKPIAAQLMRSFRSD